MHRAPLPFTEVTVDESALKSEPEALYNFHRSGVPYIDVGNDSLNRMLRENVLDQGAHGLVDVAVAGEGTIQDIANVGS